jgi:hypothetical protein
VKLSSLTFPIRQPDMPEGDVDLTPSQAKALLRAVEQAWQYDCLHSPEKYEYKEFDVRPLGAGKTIVVRSTVGLKGDEDSLASVFCRNRRQLFIGPRGKYLTYGKGCRKYTGYKALIYGVSH